MSHVFIEDGPHAGMSFDYGNPLPETLVLADKSAGIVYHDYRRVNDGHFRHSLSCKCVPRPGAAPGQTPL